MVEEGKERGLDQNPEDEMAPPGVKYVRIYKVRDMTIVVISKLKHPRLPFRDGVEVVEVTHNEPGEGEA